MFQKTLKSRNEIPELLNELGLTGNGVEVGAGSGYFSEVLLSGSKLKRLYSIDPWMGGDPAVGEYQSAMQLSVDWYIECVKRLSKFGLRSAVLRMGSADSVELFQDGSLDFVYVDANHDYPYVRQDHDLWWPKVRPGGIFSGHDYCNLHWGVRNSVNEFSADHNLPFVTTELDETFEGHEIRSWIFQKPIA